MTEMDTNDVEARLLDEETVRSINSDTDATTITWIGDEGNTPNTTHTARTNTDCQKFWMLLILTLCALSVPIADIHIASHDKSCVSERVGAGKHGIRLLDYLKISGILEVCMLGGLILGLVLGLLPIPEFRDRNLRLRPNAINYTEMFCENTNGIPHPFIILNVLHLFWNIIGFVILALVDTTSCESGVYLYLSVSIPTKLFVNVGIIAFNVWYGQNMGFVFV